MRQSRIKCPSEVEAVYHCMGRTVDGAMLFKSREKEVFRRMMERVADFSGVRILTYSLMGNHFHLLVRVCRTGPLADSELMRRYRVLYPKPTKYQAAEAKVMEQTLASGGREAAAIREGLLRRMDDLSEFMKTLKQRFSTWFNATHGRFGPLWSDRFKSVLVEPRGEALRTVAAYIDLNPVRAGLVGDPKDYRYCGYAEAVAGGVEARAGLLQVAGSYEGEPVESALRSYRLLLFGKGGSFVPGSGSVDRRAAQRVIEREDGELAPWVLLRCRVRYLTDGGILGSADFVASYLEEWRRRCGRKHPCKLRPVRGLARGALAVANNFRCAGFS